MAVNPLNAELNPSCQLLALLGANHILHVSRIRVKQRIQNKEILPLTQWPPLQITGSKIVLRASQGIRYQFPGDARIYFCNCYRGADKSLA